MQSRASALSTSAASPPAAAAGPAGSGLDRRTTAFLALICGLSVANLVLTQPLLAEIGRTFSVSADTVSRVPACAQLGYGMGILSVVPLGDSMERKRLILVLLACVALALILSAFATGILFLGVASFLVGFTTVVPQVLIPYAGAMAAPGQRARAIGGMQSALLLGLLLSRSVSGTIATFVGWRGVFFLAAAAMLLLAAGVWAFLPRSGRTETGLGYLGLLRSMGALVRTQPQLRTVSLSIGCASAAFMLFWAGLPFLLESPHYGYGPAVAGSFGLVGAGGALLAPLMGGTSDRHGHFWTGAVALTMTVAAYGAFYGGENHLWLLVVGTVLIDVGLQSSHISNQAEIFSLEPAASSRLNGIYMFTRFTGGALGSVLGGWSWSHGGWPAACLCGGLLCLGALGIHLFGKHAARGQPRGAGIVGR